MGYSFNQKCKHITLYNQKVPADKTNEYNVQSIRLNDKEDYLVQLKKLVDSLKSLAIEAVDYNKLIKGFDDDCIIVITQLLDRYLIEQNFTFHKPNYSVCNKNLPCIELDKSVLDYHEDQFKGQATSYDSTKASENSSFLNPNLMTSEAINGPKKRNIAQHNWLQELVNVNDKLTDATKNIYSKPSKIGKIKILSSLIGLNNEEKLNKFEIFQRELTGTVKKQDEIIENIKLKEKLVTNSISGSAFKSNTNIASKLGTIKQVKSDLENSINFRQANLETFKERLAKSLSKLEELEQYGEHQAKTHLQNSISKISKEIKLINIKNALYSQSIIGCFKKSKTESLYKEDAKVFNTKIHNEFDEIF